MNTSDSQPNDPHPAGGAPPAPDAPSVRPPEDPLAAAERTVGGSPPEPPGGAGLLKVFLALLVVLGLGTVFAVGGVLTGSRELTVAEVLGGTAPADATLAVTGWVVPDTAERTDTGDVRFRMRDDREAERDMPVTYRGTLPDAFNEAFRPGADEVQVTVTGTWLPAEERFTATRMTARCASTYEAAGTLPAGAPGDDPYDDPGGGSDGGDTTPPGR